MRYDPTGYDFHMFVSEVDGESRSLHYSEILMLTIARTRGARNRAVFFLNRAGIGNLSIVRITMV